MYPGKEGNVKGRFWLLSMMISDDIVGLSAAFFCTHNSPMCMYLVISVSIELIDCIFGSIMLNTVPSLQFFHTYKMQSKFLLNIGNRFRVWFTLILERKLLHNLLLRGCN